MGNLIGGGKWGDAKMPLALQKARTTVPKAPGLLAALDWEGIKDGAPAQTLLLFSLLSSPAILRPYPRTL